MQVAHKLETPVKSTMNDKNHSSRLEKILLDKNYKTDNSVVNVEYSDISIESRLEAEHELEQTLIKMFGYQ